MANLNTDLLSPEQAIEATVAAYNSKDAIEKIEGLQASASEIDGNIINTWNKDIIKNIKAASRIDILCDSIGYGVGVTNKNKLWTLNFKNLLKENTGVTNIGFVTANDANSTILEHTITKLDATNWTAAFTNRKSINGFTYTTTSANETINFYSEMASQTVVNIHYVKPIVDSVYEVYVNDVLQTTINETASGFEETKVSTNITLGSLGNDVKVKLISGSLSISGLEYSNGTTKKIQVYATGGRRVVQIGDVVSNYILADVCFFALGYNDVQGGSSEAQQLEAEGYIQTLAQNFKDNNKMFVYINFVWDIEDEANWILQKLKNTFLDYENFYILDVRGNILDEDGLVASSSYRINTLLEWYDIAHPNSNGSNRIFRFISKRIFNEYNQLSSKIIRRENDSIVSDTSSVSALAKKSIVLGEANACTQPYTFIIGNRAKTNNQGSYIANSAETGKLRQINIQQRQITTTNATETYLRDVTYTYPFVTEKNTIVVIKGYIIATDLINGKHKEFKVDAKFINNGGVLSMVSDTGYPTNGITDVKGSLLASARIVAIGTEIRFYVTGIATTVYWNAKIEVEETTIGY